MNPQAILALLGDLYQQIVGLQQRIAELEQLQEQKSAPTPTQEQ